MRTGVYVISAILLVSLVISIPGTHSIGDEITSSQLTINETDSKIRDTLRETVSGGLLENIGQIANSAILYYTEINGLYVGFAESQILFSTDSQFQHDTQDINIKWVEGTLPQGMEQLSGRVNYFLSSESYLNVRRYGCILYSTPDGTGSITFYFEDSTLNFQIDSTNSADYSNFLEYDHDSTFTVTDHSITCSYDFAPVKSFSISDAEASLVFSTYYGTEDYDCIRGMALDSEDNIYVVGSSPTWFVSKFASDGQSLIYTTYLNGNFAMDIEVDENGNAIVSGYAGSDFPESGISDVYWGTDNGGLTIVMLNATGNGLNFTAQIGTSEYPAWPFDLELDSHGNIYTSGYTQATDLPLVNAYSGYQGAYDCFIVKLNSTGNDLLYCSYFGGSECEWIYTLDLGEDGCVYIGGDTQSTDLPFHNAIDTTITGTSSTDCFVFKLNTSNNEVLYCTLIGGENSESLADIVVDEYGNLYATGYVNYGDFPVKNAICEEPIDHLDAFAFKLNSTGNGFVYSTYLGTSSHDKGSNIDLDNNGNVYIVGYTGGDSFPVVNAESIYNYGESIFITKINSEGSFITCSTFIGQIPNYTEIELEVDSSQNACVSGEPTSVFPTVNAMYDEPFGEDDAFILKFNMNDTHLAPVTTHPEDILRLYSNESISLGWVAYDTDFQSYEILKNGISIITETTTNSTVNASIVIDVSTIVTDEYTFRAVDQEGHVTNDTVQVRVFDGTNPTLDHPDDLTFEFGIGAHVVKWIPVDYNLDTFKIYKNDSLYIDGEWDGISIELDVSDFEEGVHNITVYVFDVSMNVANDTVWVHVTPDVTSPTIERSVSSYSFIAGESNHSITWLLSDASLMEYTIRLNGTIIPMESISSSEARIWIPLDDYIPAEYNFSILVIDLNGNNAYDEVWISIQESATTTGTETNNTIPSNTNATTPYELQLLSLSIAIGSLVTIVIVVVLILKSRKSAGSYPIG
ncbi:MAG: SBBP repeat-containing protein [Candidatus Thorarchaeota archaeon]